LVVFAVLCHPPPTDGNQKKKEIYLSLSSILRPQLVLFILSVFLTLSQLELDEGGGPITTMSILSLLLAHFCPRPPSSKYPQTKSKVKNYALKAFHLSIHPSLFFLLFSSAFAVFTFGDDQTTHLTLHLGHFYFLVACVRLERYFP